MALGSRVAALLVLPCSLLFLTGANYLSVSDSDVVSTVNSKGKLIDCVMYRGKAVSGLLDGLGFRTTADILEVSKLKKTMNKYAKKPGRSSSKYKKALKKYNSAATNVKKNDAVCKKLLGGSGVTPQPTSAPTMPTATPTTAFPRTNTCDSSGQTGGFNIPSPLIGRKSSGQSGFALCIGCHSFSSLRQYSYTAVYSARTKPEMSSVSGYLSNTQNAANIAAYLNCP
jgi:hypothetical protein